MSKRFIIGITIVSFVAIQACELTITNDTGEFVQVHDLNTNEKVFVIPSKTRVIGKNPDMYASFVITTQNTIFGTPVKYSGKQIACSATHKINLKVSDIEKGKVDTTLLEIKKETVNTSPSRNEKG